MTTEMNPTTERLLWPLSDAARRLGVGRSTVYNLMAEGKLSPRRIGRRVLISEDELSRYVATLTKAGASA